MGKWRHLICGLGFGVAVTAGAAQAGARCVVRAHALSLEGVTVQPAGGDAFKVDLHSVPARALLPLQARGFATLEVDRLTVPVYNGPATLRAQTQVYAQPTYGVWATVVEDIPVRVRFYSDSDWAQLSDVPGVSSGITGIEWLDAYVPLSAVVIPTAAAKP